MPLCEDTKGPEVALTSNHSQQQREVPWGVWQRAQQALNWALINREANTRKILLGRHKISLHKVDLYWDQYALVEIWLFKLKNAFCKDICECITSSEINGNWSGQYCPQSSQLISSLQQYRRCPLYQSNKRKWLCKQYSLFFPKLRSVLVDVNQLVSFGYYVL